MHIYVNMYNLKKNILLFFKIILIVLLKQGNTLLKKAYIKTY